MKIVIYTPSPAHAKEILKLCAGGDMETHLFTSTDACVEYLSANQIDLLYLCVRDSAEQERLRKTFADAAKISGADVLYHHWTGESATAVNAAAAGPAPSFQPAKSGAERTVQQPSAGGQSVPAMNNVERPLSFHLQEKPSKGQDKPATANGAKKILLAEDDPNIGKIIKHKLQSMGFDVTHVFDGQAVLDKAETLMPDLLIMDVMMPKYSGTELVRLLRMKPAFERTPILIMTASTAEEIEKSVFKGGANGFIRKPFELPVLVSTVQKLIAS